MDSTIQVGLLGGFLPFIAVILIVEKSPPLVKKMIFKHYVFSDVVISLLAFALMPVSGSAMMIAASIFVILFSLYLLAKH